MKEDKSPFAFPIFSSEGVAGPDTGLTKKEWFAGMALMGILASGKAKSPEIAVETCWHYANDMVKGDIT